MYKLLIAVFISISSISYSQEKKEIELQKVEHTTTTSYTDGSSKTVGSTGYNWRYTGSETWGSIGKRFKNIEPVLNQYESSALLLKQSKSWKRNGSITGFTMIGGGFVMAFAGFLSEKETQVENENIPGVYSTVFVSRKGLGFTGLGVLFAGFYINYFSTKKSMKVFEGACKEYNKMVGNDSGGIQSLDFGLTASNMSSYPLLSLRLSL